MRQSLALVTILLGFVSIAAAAPQAWRLYKLKNSRQFSLITWVVWLLYQLAAVAYSLARRDYVFTAIMAGWAILYVGMIGLILYYRQPHSLKNGR